jgi:hypothetical protein
VIRLSLYQVGVTELDPTAKSSENLQTPSSGAAESAAVDPDLAIVIKAWELFTAPSQSFIVEMARDVIAKSGESPTQSVA